MPGEDPPPSASGGDERGEGDAGWAAPDLPPRAPASGPTAAGSPPVAPPPTPLPAAPPPMSPPPSTPPPPWTATGPPAVARSRKTWIVVLVTAFAVIFVAVVAGTILFVDRTLPPLNAANDFLNDIIDGHQQAAQARLCAADRDGAEGAIANVVQTFGTRRAKVSINPLTIDRSGDHATVEYTVDANGKAFDHTFHIEMREENGEWKACPL